jgi:hypothetical protein
VSALTVSRPWWPTQWAYYKTVTGIWLGDHPTLLWIGSIVSFFTVMLIVIWTFKKEKLKFRSQTVIPEEFKKPAREVPIYSYICPIVPLLLIVNPLCPLNPNLAFIVGLFLAVLLTQPGSGRKITDIANLLERIAYQGVMDMAPVIAFHWVLGWVVQVASYPTVQNAFISALKPIAPSNALTAILFFVPLTVCGLFRGPSNPWGAGVILLMTMMAAKTLPPLAVLGAIAIGWDLFIWNEPACTASIWAYTYVKESPTEWLKRMLPFWWLNAAIIITITSLLYAPH